MDTKTVPWRSEVSALMMELSELNLIGVIDQIVQYLLDLFHIGVYHQSF